MAKKYAVVLVNEIGEEIIVDTFSSAVEAREFVHEKTKTML